MIFEVFVCLIGLVFGRYLVQVGGMFGGLYKDFFFLLRGISFYFLQFVFEFFMFRSYFYFYVVVLVFLQFYYFGWQKVLWRDEGFLCREKKEFCLVEYLMDIVRMKVGRFGGEFYWVFVLDFIRFYVGWDKRWKCVLVRGILVFVRERLFLFGLG